MLHLNVWLSTPYIIACANHIDMHRVSACITAVPVPEKNAIQTTAFDRITYHTPARNAHDWNVPHASLLCF